MNSATNSTFVSCLTPDLTPPTPSLSYNADNDDALDNRYGADGTRPTGMYGNASGLENALLCFTGPEYMHMVLR